MKKLFVTVLFAMGAILATQAQEINPNALGLRIGGGLGFGGEISYQHHLQENNRIEADLGWRSEHNFNAFKISGIYQWVWNIEGNFNWYAGAGAGIGNVNTRHHYDSKDGVFLDVAGDIGIEYLFDEIPLQLSLDFRPEFSLVNYHVYDTFGPDFALGIRYVF